MKIKFYGAFVLNRRVDLQAIEQAPHLTHWLICTQVSAMIIAFGLLPVDAALRVLAATAVGTIAAGAYGESVLGGVMGDFLGATICVLELAVYLALAADASRFDASAFLRLPGPRPRVARRLRAEPGLLPAEARVVGPVRRPPAPERHNLRARGKRYKLLPGQLP